MIVMMIIVSGNDRKIMINDDNSYNDNCSW